MKCKNIECQNETTGKRVYCSLTCRNIFVNKYLRNYDKVSDTFQQKKKEREEEYLENPKYCKECNQIISFDKIHDNEFYCSRSCSASHINKNRDVTWNTKISESIKNYISKNGSFGCLKLERKKVDRFCPNCHIP